MASTVFTDGSTPIIASWLNDINLSAYTTVPTLNTNLTTLISTRLPNGYVAKDSGTGGALIPYGTTAQRPSSPTGPSFRFNTTLNQWEGWNTTSWGSIGGGATGAGGDTVFQENSRVVTTNYTLTTNKNASVVGPLTINAGITVTVPTGARLVIL